MDKKFSTPIKIIRDLAHGYVNLTQFELEIIDTSHFQRLKYIRQLTCQSVYPNANHTRFEHSLGVLELTRRAVDKLNYNGYLIEHDRKNSFSSILFSEESKLNVCIAALLHDIGHCPFSHLGESQIDILDAQRELENSLQNDDILFSESFKKNAIRHTSVHEIISCIVIIRKFRNMLKQIKEIDFELICRCILGLRYFTSNQNSPEEELEEIKKNILIGLVNSDSLDMDKLDYIIRDSIHTGVSLPTIDTERLFNNIYISDQKMVYKDKALPVLQNIIDTRDNLYMYVYNHHTAIYTDFLMYYVLRRLDRNYEQLYKNSSTPVHPGAIKRSHLLSVEAVVENLSCDFDLLYSLRKNYFYDSLSPPHTDTVTGNESVRADGEKTILISYLTQIIGMRENEERIKLNSVVAICRRMFDRQYLKPWWKTLNEYKRFINQNFTNADIKSRLVERICSFGKNAQLAEEFRSQIVKDVKRKLSKEEKSSLIFEDGDFFIVPSTNKFYSHTVLENITVYFPSAPKNSHMKEYSSATLNELFPPRNLDTFFSRDSFYIFVNQEKLDKDISYSELFLRAFVDSACHFAKLTEGQFKRDYFSK